MSTTTTTSLTTPFPEGLIDEILAQLPFGVRTDMILCWAERFHANPDPAVAEIIGTITTLDLSHYRKINKRMHRKTFHRLTSLPLSSLMHLDLSQTPIGQSSKTMRRLSHPIFQNLVSLNLDQTGIDNIDSLLIKAPHTFPKLQTLILSNNENLSIPTLATTTKFPNLKVLDLRGVRLDGPTLKAFEMGGAIAVQPQTSMGGDDDTENHNNLRITIANPIPQPTAKTPPFLLEKFYLKCPKFESIPSLSRSPHLSQLNELHLDSWLITADIIHQLFDPQTSVLKNLTYLHLRSLDGSAFDALGQCKLLSNLITLTLFSSPMFNTQSQVQFLNSPFLWTPQLKHLSLKHMPRDFVFDRLVPALDAGTIKLETLDLWETKSSYKALATSSSLSELKHLSMGITTTDQGEVIRKDQVNDNDGDDLVGGGGYDDDFETLISSSRLSNLISLRFYQLSLITPRKLISLFSSPGMSNNLTQLSLDQYFGYPLKDVIKTLCTQHVIPGDESSPLKFEKLQKLSMWHSEITDSDVELIVENLTQLTYLDLARDFPSPGLTDKTITTLLAAERTDPAHYPYTSTSLPNLVHLDLAGCHISTNGILELSQSQLLDQLKHLDVSCILSLEQDEVDDMDEDGLLFITFPLGLQYLFTTPLVSNLKFLALDELLFYYIDDIIMEEPEYDVTIDEGQPPLFNYLGNCVLSQEFLLE